MGAIAVEVDDLFTFGNEIHELRMEALQEKFKFAKYEDVKKSQDGVAFNGKEFHVGLHKFLCGRRSPVQLSKGRSS